MSAGNADWPNKILVVDDESTIRTLFEYSLPTRGFEMCAVPDAETALERLEQDRFACIITDKNLPGMDGIELMHQVAQRQPQCARIIMTGYPSFDSVVEALRSGAADYLVKPFDDMDLVLEKVNTAIRHQRAVYTAHVLGLRVQGVRKDLAERDARLAQMAREIEHLSEIISVEAAGGTALTAEQQSEALATTVNLARSLLTYTANLTSILRASPLTRNDAEYIEGFAAAARRLDGHLDFVDSMRRKKKKKKTTRLKTREPPTE